MSLLHDIMFPSFISAIVVLAVTTSTNAADMIQSIPSDQLEATANFSQGLASPGATLVITISNKSTSTFLFDVEDGFPSSDVKFVDKGGNLCKFTAIGYGRFVAGIGSNIRRVELRPGSSLEWKLPLRPYFQLQPGDWKLKGSVTAIVPDTSKYGKHASLVVLPEITLKVVDR